MSLSLPYLQDTGLSATIMCSTTQRISVKGARLRGVKVYKSTPTSRQVRYTPIAVLILGVGLVAVLVLAWLGRVILLLVFAAIVVAVMMTTVVDWLKVRLKLTHRVAFALILSVMILAVSLTLWVSGPNIINQFASLQEDLPQAVHELTARARGYGWGRWVLAQWSDYSQLSSSVSFALTRIGGIVVSTATVLAGGALIAFLGLYLAAEPQVYFSGIQRAMPVLYRSTLNACAANAVRNLRWWVLSQMLSMCAVGIIVALGLWALGVPLAGTLGVIAAVLTFIPNVGPIVSVVPAVLLALAISPTKGLLTVVLFLLVHFLEGNVITPLLERKIVRLPPALTMSAQLLLAVIGGPLGLAVAAPLTAAALGVFEVLFPLEDASADLGPSASG